MRVSSRCIIINDDKVLLIYREKNGEQYYVFPGGKIEDGETKEECIIRECREELGINIEVKKYVYVVRGEDFIQHFFVCSIIDGIIGTGNKEEYDPNRVGGLQKPLFVSLSSLNDLNVVSPKIVYNILNDISNYGIEFGNKPITIDETGE